MPPTLLTIYSIYIKYVSNVVRLHPFDLTVSIYAVMSITFQVGAVIYWMRSAEMSAEFSLDHWIRGFFASLTNTVACMFMIACLSTGAPMGPSSALINSQTVLLTLVSCLLTGTVPLPLQLIGLALGILGAMILTIPDQICAILRVLFCCK